MSVHRFAARRDANEDELVKVAEKLGAWVIYGPPLDFWLWHAKTGFVPVEVKSRRGQYTQAQKRFLYQCQLNRAPAFLWRCQDDVLKSLA